MSKADCSTNGQGEDNGGGEEEEEEATGGASGGGDLLLDFSASGEWMKWREEVTWDGVEG